MKDIKRFLLALSTLSGTIIGVGLFSLPYITIQVGVFVILAYFLILGFLAIIIHLLFAEVALKTPDFLRLPGFVKLHLGKWGERFAFLEITLGLFGANLAYLIMGGKFFSGLVSPWIGGNDFVYGILFFIFGSIIIYLDIRVISKVEFLGLLLFFVVLVVIFLKGFSHFSISNLLYFPENKDWFLPYGAVLFSLWGTALIPEIEEMLGDKKHLLKKVIPSAIIIAIIAYLLFIFLIVGISGSETTEDSIQGLRNFLGDGIVSFAFLFGLLTTFTSFIVLGLTLKKIFWYDFGMKKNVAWLITCSVPLVLFIVGVNDFIKVISFVGGVTIGIDGILVILMYHKVNPMKARFALLIPLIVIFILGIIYQLIYSF
ncbi:hypothetical protein J7K24_02110 [bacterium]|nr:hypothetical protein [bacterium]